MTRQQRRAAERRAEAARVEAINHAAGRHRGSFVQSCKACQHEQPERVRQ